MKKKNKEFSLVNKTADCEACKKLYGNDETTVDLETRCTARETRAGMAGELAELSSIAERFFSQDE